MPRLLGQTRRQSDDLHGIAVPATTQRQFAQSGKGLMMNGNACNFARLNSALR